MANIQARRKLSELYKRGVELRFGQRPDGAPFHRLPDKGEGYIVDEDGKPAPVEDSEIQCWVQPPSPLHREMAMRDAQAARAKSLVRAKRDEESEEHLTIMAFLAEMSDETLLDYVLVQRDRERRDEALREVLAEDEWNDMAAYQDAMRQYEEDPRPREEVDADPEYVALLEMDAKFGAEVRERQTNILESERETMKMYPRERLEKKALDTRAELTGTQAFMHEYELQMTFYSVRDFEDHGVMFFESARELAMQEDEVREAFREALAPFIGEVAEAKNLSGVASGSESSELPSEPETSEVSIPVTVNA